MYLEHLQIRNVRTIAESTLLFSPGLNLIVGKNGAGKTSLLEAIYLLGVGRSFRSHQIKSVISNKSSELSVYGKLSAPGLDSLGISRNKTGKFKVRINNSDQSNLSSLAHYLPVLVITPDSYKLLTSGPQFRRQYLDLSVFHVEHSFSSYWQRYNRILKQRNAQLKCCNAYSDLTIWDKEYVKLAEKLNVARKNEFFLLKSHLEEIQGIFLPQYRVQYRFYDGWDSEATQSLSEQLENSFQSDKRYGYSNIGAHKADIKILIDNVPVQDVLSRGEQKMLVNAMHLAQCKRLSLDLENHCLLLIDDLPSEIDHIKQGVLLKELIKIPDVQLFITAIDNIDLFKKEFKKEALNTRVFHVEHGKVNAIENND